MEHKENLFQELSAKKQKLRSLINTTHQYGWIDDNQKQLYLNKLDSDTLVLGVIGQMKCGKSTFLNAFVFGEDVLPSATTPMTAALSVITYGESKKLKAEFYTKQEWEEQLAMASRSLESVAGNVSEESKIKAAKELVEKSKNLGNDIQSLLGTTKEDSLDNLIEYVGADGKYISITKAVTIEYPHEYLKGVEIVDTPGFNDPIVSREERTKDFLKRADVVLMMLYAGRPFDATDREIIFKNVRQCGVGKVIVGINKYDIPYCEGESEREIKDYVKEEIRKACHINGEDSTAKLLLEADPIPLSAEMALLSELPMQKIMNNEAYKHAWDRICANFEVSSQNQVYQKSHINDLIDAVKNLIDKEKTQILIAKPLNALKAIGNKKTADLNEKIRIVENLVQDLSMPDDELEDKKKGLERSERRISKNINSLADEIDYRYDDFIQNAKRELEDTLDASCRRMKNIVAGWSRFSNVNSIIHQLEEEENNLVSRHLKREVEDIQKRATLMTVKPIQDFLVEVEDILNKYLPDLKTDDIIRDIKKKINIDKPEEGLFIQTPEDSIEEEGGFMDAVGNFMYGFMQGASFGAFGKLIDIFSHDDTASEINTYINNLKNNFDPNPFLSSINTNKDRCLTFMTTEFIDRLIDPMKKNIEEILSDLASREAKLEEAKKELADLQDRQKILQAQVDEINN
ncbi:MAG: dynamin family protein [Muribaculaceae bacterium]|nr:dynamin family protein [Muribaculaceae bacterium]